MFIPKYIYLITIAGCLFGNNCKHKETVRSVLPITSNLSFTTNPANNWQVGYSLGDTLDPAQFQLCTFVDTSNNLIGLWHPAAGSGGYYPYTGQNRDSISRTDKTNSWALRPHEIAMEGSNSGQYSMLRFVAPASGKYHIKVIFEGVHFRLSTTDVHILLNSRHLFDDIIDGYGGDSTFHAITGSHPSAFYEESLSLGKNDILTFAVGYGANKSFYNDTTGLLIVIEMV
ncbi:MAG TPA: hypothetical protein VNS58_21505 [Puia sp.]|nr:hypothetical protein [Puia sp.]